jgi:hypothetical protein
MTFFGCDAVLRLFPNEIPIANAGVDQSDVPLGVAVYLDGSASRDPDGDNLSYTWFFWDAPAGSNAVLYGYRTDQPYFTPDQAGTYVFILVVDDGLEESKPDRVEITAL